MLAVAAHWRFSFLSFSLSLSLPTNVFRIGMRDSSKEAESGSKAKRSMDGVGVEMVGYGSHVAASQARPGQASNNDSKGDRRQQREKQWTWWTWSFERDSLGHWSRWRYGRRCRGVFSRFQGKEDMVWYGMQAPASAWMVYKTGKEQHNKLSHARAHSVRVENPELCSSAPRDTVSFGFGLTDTAALG
ncbi:hypothetical protein LX32DRAFT_658310 [Colletotrichum zoysiae]|uniref:Secreted protein n=1 Tax=Colletotrichum zoysiae TaxID=1216348 RepID=A0AAD9H515_9PEZI|nr:hypothetical protein LX32DRAFT_658310 [Colletotrichum zoysiae]